MLSTQLKMRIQGKGADLKYKFRRYYINTVELLKITGNECRRKSQGTKPSDISTLRDPKKVESAKIWEVEKLEEN